MKLGLTPCLRFIPNRSSRCIYGRFAIDTHVMPSCYLTDIDRRIISSSLFHAFDYQAQAAFLTYQCSRAIGDPKPAFPGSRQ